MIQRVNKRYSALFTEKPRYIICMGGRAGGRSMTASQFALAKLRGPDYFRCAVMRYVLSDVRNSIFQDIQDRVEENELEDEVHIRENPVMRFSYGSNRIDGLAFKKSNSQQKAKLKSLAGYNCVIIEEADEVSEEDFMQLDDSLRTLKSDITVILLLNPPSKQHWIIKRWFNLLPSEVEGFYKPELKTSHRHNTIFIHTTYLDNIQNLNESTVRNFENYRIDKPEHYWNMIRGLVSEGARGRIYTTWQAISDAEYESLDFEEFYGLDFGFTNDPTALVGIKHHNNRLYLRELLYETGLTNQDIAVRLESLGVSRDAPIYADSSEPKSIEEIQQENWNILPAVKGQDSVRVGIDFIKGKKVFYTESSDNIDTESQEYKWGMDRDKNPTNVPVDAFNHLMDAARYGTYTHLKFGQMEIHIA